MQETAQKKKNGKVLDFIERADQPGMQHDRN